jgi:hypothetical protein
MTDLKLLAGVGDKTKAHLLAAHIYSIEELAQTDPKTIRHIPNYDTLVSRAKVYGPLETKETKNKFSDPLETKNKVSDPPETQSLTKWLISDHSWYEKAVEIIYDGQRHKAIVYDLSIEPCEQIAVLCSWACENDITTCSFSLPFIAALNLHLPLFVLKVHPSDVSEWKNRHSIHNAIDEANILLNNEL